MIEQCAANEEGLVAVNSPVPDAAEIIEERDQLEPPIVAREQMHESTGVNSVVGLHLVQPLHRSGRQDGFGMEKEGPFAVRLLLSDSHLGAAAFEGVKREVSDGRREALAPLTNSKDSTIAQVPSVLPPSTTRLRCR